MDSAEIDNLLIELKPFGFVQISFLICSAYVQFFIPLTGQSINFLAATPNHHCVLQDGFLLNQSIPVERNGDVTRYSKCEEFVDPGSPNTTQKCQAGWDYDHDVYGETIISEWDLVCDQNAAAELSQSVLQVGGLIGAFVFGLSADHYGRRPSFLVAIFLFSLFGTALCFSVNFIMFVSLRFCCGFAQMATSVAFSSSISEYMIPKYRNRATNVPSISFSFGLMFLALMAFLIQDWRYLQLAIVSPITIGFFAMWFLPESLRWVLSKGNVEQSEKLIEKLAKMNKSKIPQSINKLSRNVQDNDIFAISGTERNADDMSMEGKYSSNPRDNEQTSVIEICTDSENLEETNEKNVNGSKRNDFVNNNNKNVETSIPRDSYLDLFKSPVLLVTVVTCTLRFAHSMIYFGFALSTGRLEGNPYVNYFYSALVEVPARLLSPYAYKVIRRTYLVSFSYFACAAGLAVMIFLPSTTTKGVDLSTLKNVLSLLGKFFIVLSRGGVLLLIVELYPTTMRNKGNGLATCISRIGAIISPFMLYLDNFIPDFSTILMTIIACIAACIVLTLPDTRRTAQPQTVEELKQIMQSQRKVVKGHQNECFEDNNSDQ
ncbi:solute carrier family 22 member 21-like isoform X1 [Apostichopus japonicus]|uniref:solute carrier family 22 member 21-like isoform X1 n=1 Tax=Stichopus japonicus TaxID=307972 RepID=UPI003AB57210